MYATPSRTVCTAIFVNGVNLKAVSVGADRDFLNLACKNTRFVGSLQEFGYEVLLNKETAVARSGFVQTTCRSSGKSFIHMTARCCRSICCKQLFAKRCESLFIVLAGSGFRFGFFYVAVFGFNRKKFLRSVNAFIPRTDFALVLVDFLLLVLVKETIFSFRFVKDCHSLESSVLSLCFHFKNFLHVHLCFSSNYIFLILVFSLSSLSFSLAFLAAFSASCSLLLHSAL